MTASPTSSSDRSFARAAAFGISALTSPYVITAFTVVLIVRVLHPTLPQLLLWSALSAFFAAVLPFTVVFLLWRTGRVTDIHVAVREQRALPFIAALASGAIGVAVLHLIGVPRVLVALGVVYLVVGLALALISLYWKISVHSGVVTAAVMVLVLAGYEQAAYALPLIPLVLWARTYRGRHTFAQGVVPLVLAALLTPLAYYGALALVAP